MKPKPNIPAPNFPLPIKINQRWYWHRAGLEAYKCAMIGLPPPPRSEPDIAALVPAKVVAQEFGIGRRTLGRRLASVQQTLAPEVIGTPLAAAKVQS
jgi:hypothetical protein